MIDGNQGFGFGLKPAVADVEGHFGAGFVLGINLTLDVQTVANLPAPRNLPYSLSYINPADGQPVLISISHDPGVPFQELLPEDVAVTLDIPASLLFFSFSQTFVIVANTQVVIRPRLQFLEAYARITKKRFL
ncbi:MAG: hypothetical protein V4621_08095 [Pseudomonadota bacterium]